MRNMHEVLGERLGQSDSKRSESNSLGRNEKRSLTLKNM